MASEMPVNRGIHPTLEAAANELLFEDVKKIKRHSENDILTPWKEKDRRKREIYVTSGVADPTIRKGNFHKVANTKYTELNSRDGVAPPRQERWNNEH